MIKFRDSSQKNLWLIRIYYMFCSCANGCMSPFINLFYINRGLSGTEIGLLGTITAVSGLISAPFWGHLNDSISRPRRMLQVALAVNSLAYFLISRQDAFLYLAIIVGVNGLITSGIDPLQSTQALGIADRANAGFGSIRLFGSLGWAITAPLSGILIQHTSLLSAFYAYVGFMLLAAFVMFFIKGDVRRPQGQEPVEKLPMLQIFKEMVKNRELMALLAAMTLVWLAMNCVKFESVYLQQLGATSTVIGWVNTIGAVIEIPMMLVSDRVMRRFSPVVTLIMGFLFYAFGLVFIMVHPAVLTIVIYRALAGVALSFYYISYTNFIVRRAPAGQTATVMALYSVTFAGIVNIVASSLCGWIVDSMGIHYLYVIAAISYITAAAIIYLTVARRSLHKTPPSGSTLEAG